MLQKQLFTLIISLVSLHLFSQNNNGTLYALDLTIDGETTRYIEEDCSFRYWPAFSPGNAYEPFCGEMIWAFSDNGDSLLCDPSSAHNLGKIVLVRRGNCVFFSKIQHAMNTGAKAVIILNHFTNQNETECSLSMPGLETVPSIHSFFMSRQLGTIITTALAEAKTVPACFNPTTFSRPFAEYSYAIPVSHVGPMDQISVNFHNATGTTQEFQFKATSEEPGGNIVELDTFATVESYANSGFSQKIQFPTYYAPAEIGEFNVTFSSSHPEVTSTISRKFIHTEHTFAADNLQPTTYVCTHNLTQQTGPCKWSVVYHTGPAGERPTYATVGIENGDLVAGTSLSILL